MANDPDSGGPRIWFHSALKLHRHGEIELAMRLYLRVVHSGHGKVAPAAAYELAFLLSERGEDEEAIACFRIALDSPKPRLRASAALALGRLLQATGDDVDGVRDAYKLAVGIGDADSSPQAAYLLGRSYLDESDPLTAQRYLRIAVDSGHAEWAPRAAFWLGQLLEEAEDLKGAVAVWSVAADAGDADTKSRALVKLALYGIDDDPEMAEATLREAAALHAPQWASIINYQLGRLLIKRGAVDEAQSAFTAGMQGGDPQWSPECMVGLGYVFQIRGDHTEARRWYNLVIDSGAPDAAETAAEFLADLPD